MDAVLTTSRIVGGVVVRLAYVKRPEPEMPQISSTHLGESCGWEFNELQVWLGKLCSSILGFFLFLLFPFVCYNCSIKRFPPEIP